MPTSATGSEPVARHRLSRAGGFTLIELLVVVLLIGLLTSLAVLALRGSSPGERLAEEAARLYARMQLAREEAVLRAHTLGLEVATGEYRFLELAEGQWRPLAADRLLGAHELPADTRLRAELDGLDVVLVASDEDADGGAGDEEQLRPQIFFLATGELLPDFSLHLRADAVDAEHTIAPGEETWLELTEEEG